MNQQQSKPEQTPTPKWDQSPAEIGSELASSFYPTASLFHAELRREIIKVIEAEREVTMHYMTQMGRCARGGIQRGL